MAPRIPEKGGSNDFNIDAFKGSELFEADTIEKSHGIKEKFKGVAHKIRDHLRPTSREGAEPSSIKKAAKSLAGKIASGASKAKEKAKGFFKNSGAELTTQQETLNDETKGPDFKGMVDRLKNTEPNEGNNSDWEELKKLASGSHSDTQVLNAIKTLGKLLDTRNNPHAQQKAKEILKDLVPAKSENYDVERGNIPKRKNIAEGLYVLYINNKVPSLQTGIEETFHHIFNEHPGYSLVVDPDDRKIAWLNMAE